MRTAPIFAQTHTSERTMSPTGLYNKYLLLVTFETNDNYSIRFEISNNSSTIRFDSKWKNTIRTSLQKMCGPAIFILAQLSYNCVKITKWFTKILCLGALAHSPPPCPPWGEKFFVVIFNVKKNLVINFEHFWQCTSRHPPFQISKYATGFYT